MALTPNYFCLTLCWFGFSHVTMELPSAYVIRLMFNSVVVLGLILCADYGRRQLHQLSDHRAMLAPGQTDLLTPS